MSIMSTEFHWFSRVSNLSYSKHKNFPLINLFIILIAIQLHSPSQTFRLNYYPQGLNWGGGDHPKGRLDFLHVQGCKLALQFAL